MFSTSQLQEVRREVVLAGRKLTLCGLRESISGPETFQVQKLEPTELLPNSANLGVLRSGQRELIAPNQIVSRSATLWTPMDLLAA